MNLCFAIQHSLKMQQQFYILKPDNAVMMIITMIKRQK